MSQSKNGNAARRFWTVVVNVEFPHGVMPAALLNRLRRVERRIDRLNISNPRDMGQLVWALETLAARVGKRGAERK